MIEDHEDLHINCFPWLENPHSHFQNSVRNTLSMRTENMIEQPLLIFIRDA